jgi:hypothetical protein
MTTTSCQSERKIVGVLSARDSPTGRIKVINCIWRTDAKIYFYARPRRREEGFVESFDSERELIQFLAILRQLHVPGDSFPLIDFCIR